MVNNMENLPTVLEIYDRANNSTWKLCTLTKANKNILYNNHGFTIIVSDEQAVELVDAFKAPGRYSSVAITLQIIHKLIEEEHLKRNLDLELYTWEDYEK